eukprot:scaffold103764_cov17-Tisochrysis_lutea.AAC.3
MPSFLLAPQHGTSQHLALGCQVCSSLASHKCHVISSVVFVGADGACTRGSLFVALLRKVAILVIYHHMALHILKQVQQQMLQQPRAVTRAARMKFHPLEPFSLNFRDAKIHSRNAHAVSDGKCL